MRPTYTQYHDIKAKLEALRRDIETTYGYCPSEDEAEDGGGSAYTSEDDAYPAPGEGGSGGGSSGASSVDAAHTAHAALAPGLSTSSASQASSSRSTSASPAGPRPTSPVTLLPPPVDLAQLQEEKRSLHSYLKNYEREFQRTHGRQVMHNDDILPVANEYRRYKDLKAFIKGQPVSAAT